MKKIMCMLLISVIFVTFSSCGNALDERSENLVELNSWYFTSGIPNNAIKVKHYEENAKFELHVDNGEFWVVNCQEYLQTATVDNGDTVYWHLNQDDREIKIAYVDIIAKLDDYIVGYAVVKISQEDNTLNFRAEIIKSAVFPKVGDKYQKVSSKQVQEKIKYVKH